MSKIASYNNNNSRFPQKSFEHSLNIDDLIRENEQLKHSIEELIEQNTQLTQIIEELSNQNPLSSQNAPNLNQEELQALAHQVIELQQQLDAQRQKKQQSMIQGEGDAEQTIKIIEELSNEFQTMQEHYQNEIQKLQEQLMGQKGQCKMILESTESRFNKTLDQYQGLLNKLKVKDDIIADLQNRLTQTSHTSKKQLKISTTIEDLRQTLQKQIEEKQRTIRVYEELIRCLRVKLNEK